MAAATPEAAQSKWLTNFRAGVAKYRAKLTEMHSNYSAGLARFWGSAGGVATGRYNAAVTDAAASNMEAHATESTAAKWLKNARAGATR